MGAERQTNIYTYKHTYKQTHFVEKNFSKPGACSTKASCPALKKFQKLSNLDIYSKIISKLNLQTALILKGCQL